MTTLSQIKELILAVQASRVAADAAKTAYYIVLHEWEADHVYIIDTMADTKEEQQLRESQLREAVVEYYVQTNDRTLTPGVSIRVMRAAEYNDTAALEWAIKHGLALKLDTKAFANLVLNGVVEPDVAQVVEIPTATIATDLSKIAEE